MSFKQYWVLFWSVLFLVPEVFAATDGKKGGTMSEWIWSVFAIRVPDPPYAFLRRFILGGMLWALMFHFFFASSVIPVILFGAGMAWAIWYHHRVELPHD